MSDELKNTTWELGMELPSRKQTHSKKKKQKPAEPHQEPQVQVSPAADSELHPEPTEAAMPSVSSPVQEEVPHSPEENLEEEARPFYSRWQWMLLMIFTPAVVLLTLAYGRLGYVHDVPDHVRSQVPAYQQGEAFLVLKPWWFGPPIFTLDDYKVPPSDYPLSRADHFARYKIELGDYARIVDGPRVLWTFQQDLLN